MALALGDPMLDDFRGRLAPMRAGLVLAVLTLAYGFGLGAVFGAAEDSIKSHLKEEALAVLDTAYGGDEAKAKKVYDKSWTYMKRAHLHANGLGTSSLALILLLSYLVAGRALKAIAAAFLGAGALGYSLFWMLSGLRAPGLGSTGAAKDSLEWLAIPTAGMCIAGLLAVLVVLVITAYFRKR